MIPRLHPGYTYLDLGACFRLAGNSSVRNFEARIAYHAGHFEALSFRYGRMGLYFLLKALGAEGKRVLLPSYTCVVVAHAIVQAGAIPVFIDSAPGRFQPTPGDFLSRIDADTVMIIPTHLFGIPEEVEELWHIVKVRHPSVFVLQDCAHSMFCRVQSGEVVTQFGHGGLFGFNISKLVNAVHGGCLTLRDSALAREVRRVAALSVKSPSWRDSARARLYVAMSLVAFRPRSFSFVHWLMQHTSLLNSELKYYSPTTIELPSDGRIAMTEFEGEIGVRSLSRFADRIARRRELAELYMENFSGLQETLGIELPLPHPGSTWSHFPLVLPKQHRAKVLQHFRVVEQVEIGTIIDYVVPDMPAYSSFVGAAVFPRSRELAAGMINLPLTLVDILPIRKEWRRHATRISEEIVRVLQGEVQTALRS